MQSVPSCGQTELSWEENSPFLTKKRPGAHEQIRRFREEHGSAQTQGKMDIMKRLNTELVKIAIAIVDMRKKTMQM